MTKINKPKKKNIVTKCNIYILEKKMYYVCVCLCVFTSVNHICV